MITGTSVFNAGIEGVLHEQVLKDGKIYNVPVVKLTADSVVSIFGQAAAEGGGGSVTVTNSAFEGSPFASVRLIKRDGYQNYFALVLDGSLGNPAQYAIWADDGTVLQNSVINNTGLKPLRLYDMVYVDLSNWGAFDSRVVSITANKCFGVTVRLGQQDTFTCSQYIGVAIHNQSAFWSPKIENKGFVP